MRTAFLITNPRVGNSAFTVNNATKLFAPRVSLAWDPSGNGKTAVRAGYGMYYSLIDNLAFLLNSIPPYNGAISRINRCSTICRLLPVCSRRPACGPGVLQPCSTFAPQGVQSDAKTPALQNWNISIEQQLSKDMSLRIAYIGSHGYHGLLSVDPNTVFPQVCATATCRYRRSGSAARNGDTGSTIYSCSARGVAARILIYRAAFSG